MDLIKEALSRGRPALTEHESKQLLQAYGIPVNQEQVAMDAESAVSSAAGLGFPVVLKAAGTSLFHKTELEAVALNLRSEDAVRKEAERLLNIPGCECLLVEEMVPGSRELVCGLIRDVLFGPCVMFGLGGILTEILEDTVFRLAPLTVGAAIEMASEIRTRKILNSLRGESAVAMDALSRTLVALGEIGMQHPEVAEIDINPLKIRPDGNPVAVDALVVLKASS